MTTLLTDLSPTGWTVSHHRLLDPRVSAASRSSESAPVNVRTVTRFCANDVVQNLMSWRADAHTVLRCGQTEIVHSASCKRSHRCLEDYVAVATSHILHSSHDRTTLLQAPVADVMWNDCSPCTSPARSVHASDPYVIFVEWRFGIAAIWCKDLFFAAANIVAWSAWLRTILRYVSAFQDNFDQMKTEQSPGTRILQHPALIVSPINHHIACSHRGQVSVPLSFAVKVEDQDVQVSCWTLRVILRVSQPEEQRHLHSLYIMKVHFL